MWYVFNQFLLFIVIAFVIGLFVGWVTFRRREKGEAESALFGRFAGGKTFFPLAIIVFAIGLLLAAYKVVPDEAGLFFDMLLWLTGAYLAGCFLGFLLRLVLLGDASDSLATARAPLAAAGSGAAVAARAAAPALAVARPFAWTAVKAEGGITLTGVVPSDQVRSRVVAAARAAAPGVAVTDRMALAAGDPAQFESMATTGVAQLGRLSDGTAQIVDTVYSISGRAPTRDVYTAVMRGTQSLPGSFRLGRADVTAPAEPEAPAAAVAAVPLAASAVAPAPTAPTDGDKPPTLAGPRGGKADDLKRIRGIGPQNEGRLHALGVWHFDQIAAWTPKQVEWVGDFLAFPGRIEREQWVSQARILTGGGETEFSKRVDRGEVATSVDDGSKGQANVAAHVGRQPQALAAPRGGKGDDLKLISGVGSAIEDKLHKNGIWHFDQIAAMTRDELEWVSAHVGFPGRALRDNWAGECKVLAAGGDTEHSRAVKAGKIPTSRDKPD